MAGIEIRYEQPIIIVGEQGPIGIGISSTLVDGAGDLIITYTDASQQNAGNVIGPKGDAGVDGATWLNGASDPASGLGNVGDFYLNNTSNDYFEKTDGTTWTLRGNIKGVQGDQGIQGPQGIAGTDGATWLNGSGAPAGGLGEIGDFYLNNTNSDYFEKTASTTWTQIGNLKGLQGDQGPQGIQGIQGVSVSSAYIDGSNHLILVLSDASEIDAGLMPNNSLLIEDFEKTRLSGLTEIPLSLPVINGSNLDFPAMKGKIVNDFYKDNTTVIDIDATAQSLPAIAFPFPVVEHVWLDETGTLQKGPNKPLPYENNKLYVGGFASFNNTILSVTFAPWLIQTAQSYRYKTPVTNFKEVVLNKAFAAADASIGHTEATYNAESIDYQNFFNGSSNDPNNIVLPNTSNASFLTQPDRGGVAPYTGVDGGQYDFGGLQPVGATEYTYFDFYIDSLGQLTYQYGSQKWATRQEALKKAPYQPIPNGIVLRAIVKGDQYDGSPTLDLSIAENITQIDLIQGNWGEVDFHNDPNSDIVHIRTEADFPDPVGGYIDLVAGKRYLIDSDSIVLNNSIRFAGPNTIIDGRDIGTVMQFATSNGASIVNNAGVGVSMQNLTLISSDTQLFDVDGAGSPNVLFNLREIQYAFTNKLGTITDFFFVRHDNYIIADTVVDGFDHIGTFSFVNNRGINSLRDSANPDFDFSTATAIGNFQFRECVASVLSGTNKFADINPAIIGNGLIIDGGFIGSTEPLGAGINWENVVNFRVSDVFGITDTKKIADITLDTPFTITNTATKAAIGGTWTDRRLSQFIQVSTGGRVGPEYQGQDIGDEFEIIATISGIKNGGGTGTFEASIFIDNGTTQTELPDSIQSITVSSTSANFVLSSYYNLKNGERPVVYMSSPASDSFDADQSKITVKRVQ